MELQNESLDDFEPLVKELYAIAFSSENTAKSILFPSKISYIEACHKDYNNAQNRIVTEIINLYEVKKVKEQELIDYRRTGSVEKATILQKIKLIRILDNRILVLRRLTDSIAFRIFNNQVWLAKRFDIQNKIAAIDIPAIKSNLESANLFNAKSSKDFALISDLTTFIGVGDLIYKTYLGNGKFKWLIVELKVGKINKILGEHIESGGTETGEFAKKLDKNTSEQFARMVKQKERRDKVTELVNTNKGTDLKTGNPLILSKNSILFKAYDTELISTIEGAKKEKVCLSVIEGCYSIFASTLSELDTFTFLCQIASPEKNSLLKDVKIEVSDKKGKKQVKLIHSFVKDLLLHNMHSKWRTPFFALPISEELMLDILFKRIKVFLYLDIDAFIKMYQAVGFKFELLSKKQTTFYKNKLKGIELINGKAIQIICPDGTTQIMGDGLFNRVFVDLVRPSALIHVLKNTAVEAKNIKQ